MRKKPVILEFHSKIIVELEVKLATTSSFLKRIIRMVRIAIEKKYLYALVKASAGFITMGRELAEHYQAEAGSDKPSAIIFNGCDVASIPKMGFKPFNDSELDIVFLGSRPDPWHGLPRLLRSIEIYRSGGGKVKVTLHFVGKIDPSDIGVSETDGNYRFHGVLGGEKLDQVMAKMNLAVCTLAQYQKQLDETSAIKTVEYLARAIPFLIGYEDTALTGQNGLTDTYLRVSNDDSNIDMEQVVTFCKKVTEERESVMARMRTYAESNCDWGFKMNQYYDFACSI
jgi:hypothetical protein